MEDFFDNYVNNNERNYNIYCVKYEMFWNNISIFNKALGIPDIIHLYPERKEKPKQLLFMNELNIIYKRLILKMNSMKFIEFLPKIILEKSDNNVQLETN
jgi:hypothetical protein